MTKKEILDAKLELMKRYKNDLPLFCAEQLQIRTKSGELKPFILNRPQIKLHNFLEQQIYDMDKVRSELLKARQMGFSTYLNARNFHKTIFNPGWQSFVFAHDTSSSDSLFKMIRRFYDKPQVEGLYPVASTANYQELAFGSIQSSMSVGTGGSKGLGRGKTFNSVHSSETAFQDRAEDHLTGLLQTVADIPGTEIVLESTANGAGNIFYDMCMRSMNGQGEFRLFFAPFYWMDDYKRDATDFVINDERPDEETPSELEYYNMHKDDEIPMTIEHLAWRRHKIESDFSGDYGRFKQEYPTNPIEAFNASGSGSWIKADWIRRAKAQETVAGYDKHPIVFGVDPAGTGGDKFVVCIRQGRNILAIIVLDKDSDITRNTNTLISLINDYNPQIINIDAGGLGLPIYDTLKNQNFGSRVRKVNFGGEPDDKKKYRYKMDEMFDRSKEWIQDSPVSMYHIDPKMIEQMISQSAGRIHFFDIQDRFRIESKKEFKKRLKYSPDIWDGVMLTHATIMGSGKSTNAAMQGTITGRAPGLNRKNNANRQRSGRRR